MEKAIVIIIGVAAAVYIARLVWKAARGEGSCHCGSCNGDCNSNDKSTRKK